VLSRTSLFRHLDDAELDEIIARARRRVFKKGHLVFREGDEARSLFVILEGLVKVYVGSDDGDEMVLATLRPPDVFGEIAVVDGRPRSASAQTLDATTVLELERDAFLELVGASPSMTEALLTSLGDVLRRLTEQASDLVFLDLHGRVAKRLVAMAGERGERVDEACELDLEVTQSDLAKMVGGSRQSVNQILSALERRGYLEMSGRKFVIRDLPALRRRAGL
jgi:CRP/FNR family cyclic AMP-dependent transcriptional regulator